MDHTRDAMRYLVAGNQCGKSRYPWELELELDDAHAASAAYREVIAVLAADHPILATRDAGRSILDRLRMAEEVSHDSVVEGLFELRDALGRALALVKLDGETRGPWRELATVLKRWGDVPLQLVRRDR